MLLLAYETCPNVYKVHADASKYDSGATKQEIYDQVLEQAEALFKGQRNWVKPSRTQSLHSKIVPSTDE